MQLLNVYKAILFHNQEFEKGDNQEIKYHFNLPEYQEVIKKYKLNEIAGNGTDIEKAINLLKYLSPRLTHSPWYDNHIECNAIKLLEYSLDNKEQGINCLNKAKILQECCLALGIYARRVCLMPYSPFDFDNHVVTEVFDKENNKWVMLDPSTNGYFVNIRGERLSVLEIRNHFAEDDFVTFVATTDSLKNLHKLSEEHLEMNRYIAKNMFYFIIDKESTFGVVGERLLFVPKNYSVKKNNIVNTKWRIKNLPIEYQGMISSLEKKLKALEASNETKATSIEEMEKTPKK